MYWKSGAGDLNENAGGIQSLVQLMLHSATSENPSPVAEPVAAIGAPARSESSVDVGTLDGHDSRRLCAAQIEKSA